MYLPATNLPPLELWGGVECTVNRVGDQFFDQLERTGHAQRPDDLERFAALGIKAIRYPVLWERTAPQSGQTIDWSWADERLGRLRQLGIRPIVGLVHHGSGPRHTNLLDEGFAPGLANFARAFAERYPWIDAYTPINEPLTTARFSGLYGYWYPHGRNDHDFIKMLLNECRAVVLAMEAIREVNPQAQLVQTEDLGKTYTTPVLEYQAQFENERRWLTFDLLCGRVNPHYWLWDYLCQTGVSQETLEWFAQHPCPPDVLGLNYYLTSERYLDERLDLYPPDSYGGNGQHRYADVEAVRVRAAGLVGPEGLLKEVWERYHLPIAITEVHNGCTREEQMRWFVYVWQALQRLREEGVAVQAATAWSLLGAYDWNKLLTSFTGHYEPGIFDLRSPKPRPTALARLLRQLADSTEPDHPVLAEKGWWERPNRLIFGFSLAEDGTKQSTKNEPDFARVKATKPDPPRPVLITGATGTLGKAFARMCERRGLAYRLLTRPEMDIADPTCVKKTIEQLQPWAVVNAAGYVRVDQAEQDQENCWRENTEGPAALAGACADFGAKLLTFSSDLVFDGEQCHPYRESDPPHPRNVYGQSKAEAERRVLQQLPSALVIRTSAFFGPWDEQNFVLHVLRALTAGQSFVIADNGVISPTYIPDLVNATLDLLIDGESGLWHLANEGALSWADLARQVAHIAGLDSELVEVRPAQLPAFRPAYSALTSERGTLLPPIDEALHRFVRECQVNYQQEVMKV